MKKPLFLRGTLFLLFLGSSQFIWAQPSNDLAANAVILTPAATCGSGSQAAGQNLANATYTSGANSGTCTNVNARDVWYKFVATNTTHLIGMSNLGANWGGAWRIQLLTNSVPADGSGTWTNVSCINATTTNATGLTVGTTYFIRIHNNTTGAITGDYAFSICVTQPPPNTNDLVANATVLTPAYGCGSGSGATNQSLAGATYTSGATAAGCVTVNATDVWYKFVANNSSLNIGLTRLGFSWGGNARIQLLTNTMADGSGAWTNFGCASGASYMATGLSVGTTYFVRVNYNSTTVPTGSGWGFDICVQFLPANDLVANAHVLTSKMACELDVNQKLGQTLAGATYTAGATSTGCVTVNTTDVWYKFTATYTAHNIILNNLASGFWDASNNPLVKIQLLTNTIPATGAGTWTSVACANTTSLAAANLTIGTVYFVRISRNNTTVEAGANWNFDICVTDPTVRASRMNEVFRQTKLSDENVLNDPWEVTYGPDGFLWVTESKGYKVQRINPNTGAKTQVLDLDNTAPATGITAMDTLRKIAAGWGNPQGGFAGMALHPKFTNPDSAFVYIGFVHRYLSTAGGSAGVFYRNFIVRFKFDGTSLGNPAIICDTIPGSSDHNSQRMIIAPVTPGGPSYLFYAAGDLGAGQFGNRMRPMHAQDVGYYEGKILRFNLVEDGDPATPAANRLNPWIPNDNPYNGVVQPQSAVYSIGIRNNQGFAYDTALNILYGSSHGAYSDDEINVIAAHRNYGHPRVIGFASDGNYNGTTAQPSSTSITAGATFTDNNGVSTCMPIGNEANNASTIGADYYDPLFSAYAAPNNTIATTWATNTPANNAPTGGWKSEAWSGLGLYTGSYIPGWKKSLVGASLKWGRLVRLKMGATGLTTLPSNTGFSAANTTDTVIYFGSTNRYRDIDFSPNGKDIFIVMDKSATTSGPSAANPVAPACPGCLLKYTFLGYVDNGGKSTIPATIDVSTTTANQCVAGSTVVINDDNKNLWVPITGPDGNIVAEIYPNGNLLDTVWTSIYRNTGALRSRNGVYYLDRNITIIPKNQPTLPAGSPLVKIRLYMTTAEYNALDGHIMSGINSINDLRILKNNDACLATINASTTLINPQYKEAHGAGGYMVQGDISGFSSFYIAASNMTLPVDLLFFTGTLQTDGSALLKWRTANEINVADFTIERSLDAINYTSIGTRTAVGAGNTSTDYNFTDPDASRQAAPVVFYRLRSNDIDGRAKYSTVIALPLKDITGKITVAPNPVNNVARVTLVAADNGQVQYQLTDITGRVLQQGSMAVRKGVAHVFNVDMGSMPSAIYNLKVSGAGINTSVKLRKE